MSCLALYYRQHGHRLGSRLMIATGLFALLTAGPASAHSGPLDVQLGTTLTATFTIGSPANGSAVSGPVGVDAGNVEVNSPPLHIRFGFESDAPGLQISMADVGFSNPSVGSFDLTGWALDLVTPVGFPGAALASDGSFAMADHELRIDRGMLSGTLVGFGPIQRDFASDPLTLTQLSALTGIALGDTDNNGFSFVSFTLPFLHTGSLAALSGLSVDVLIQGGLVADGSVGAIPEPSAAALFVCGLAVVGAWRFRCRS